MDILYLAQNPISTADDRLIYVADALSFGSRVIIVPG